nr:serine protease [Candidatus Paceibacterota bacterium]
RQDQTLGLAFVLEGGAYVVTNGSLLRGGEDKDNGPYVMTLPNGTKLTSKVAVISPDQRIAILNVTKTEPVPAVAKNILTDLLSSPAPAVVGLRLSASDLTLGQTLIAVGSTSGAESPVTVGLVSSLVRDEGNATSTVAVKTNAATSDNLGAPLLNARGELSGMTFESGSAVPARLIRSLIDHMK